MVNPEERTRYGRYMFQKTQTVSFNRALVEKCCLSMSMKPVEWTFQANQYGKPQFIIQSKHGMYTLI